MKISLEWLTDFLKFTEENPLKIADKLTESSAEVDGVIDISKNFKNVVVGEILEIRPHPDADKLQITITKADKERSIVCGAKNIKVGQKIPVALPGAKIGDFIIEERTMRGEKSEGMLCSGRELGLSEDHEGILILDSDAEINQDFAEYMGLKDAVLEIENTAITNRADLFAHYGFAREFVANKLADWQKGKENYLADLEKLAEIAPKKEMSFEVEITDPELCPRWCGIEVENVEIAPSPKYIQTRLRNCGIRPINNVVDATNYVMLELGMPMHAFDREKIHGKKLVMRPAKKGEKMKTLDDKEHEMPENAIVFEDRNGLFDLCGLMGGQSSEVGDETKNLLIHAPVYDPVRIRRTALKLDHRTDAAVIYEKGVPPASALPGLMRTVQLILEMCPNAKMVSAVKDIQNFDKKERKIELKKSLIERIIGSEIKDEQVEEILSPLGFKTKKEVNSWEITVPAYRLSDIKISEDIAEEVVRIYGLNKIEAKAPEVQLAKMVRDPKKLLTDKIADTLVDQNFYEILNFAFLGPDLLKRLDLQKSDQTIEVANPLSADQSLMRESLFPRLIENAGKNSRYFDKFRIFECAKVFSLSPEKTETLNLTGLLAGEDFYVAKGIIEVVFRALNYKVEFKSPKIIKPFVDKTKIADIIVQGKRIGFIAELNSKAINEFSLKAPVGIFELDIEIMANLKPQKKVYKALPKYPGITYDLSVLAPKGVTAEEVLNSLKNIDELICNMEILEIFEGKGVPEYQKSITLSFEFRSTERTLTEIEAKKIEEKIINKLEKQGIKKRFS